jgi:hypothetical protein
VPESGDERRRRRILQPRYPYVAAGARIRKRKVDRLRAPAAVIVVQDRDTESCLDEAANGRKLMAFQNDPRGEARLLAELLDELSQAHVGARHDEILAASLGEGDVSPAREPVTHRDC